MATDVLVRLRQTLPTLRPAEQRIGRAVLENAGIVRDSTITELAKLCETSPATVARFCNALGFSGYPEFRMEVSTAAGREEAERARFSIGEGDIDPRDSVAIEDSEYGVAAAVAAGMATIAVPLHVPIPESPAYTRWPDLAASTPAALAEVLAAHRAGAPR